MKEIEFYENTLEPINPDDIFNEHREERVVDVSNVEDAFEWSCRLIDEIICGFFEGDRTNYATATPPLVAVLSPPQVILHGVTHDLTCDGVLFVQALINAKGLWVSSKEIDVRSDRVVPTLPAAIRDLIVSCRGKGSRLLVENLDGVAKPVTP